MHVFKGLLIATAVGASTGFAQQSPRQYDVYRFGVRAAELSIGGTPAAPV